MTYMKIHLTIFLLIVGTLTWNIHKEPTLAPYDIQKSKDYTLFASAAACPRECIESWSCKLTSNEPLSEVSYFQNSTTKVGVYIGYSAKRDLIVVAFRGISNVRNWIEQANFEKVPYIFCIKCQIHSGFYADYLLFEQVINAKIISLINAHSQATVLVTGHSLGGAMAMVCGLQLRRIYPTVKLEIHTYGAPRIGTKQLAKHMNSKIQNIYRVVRGRDIVPHMPPDLPKFEYHHSAYEIFFDKDMKEYKTCGDTGEDRSCSNQYFPDYVLDENSWYFRNIESPEC